MFRSICFYLLAVSAACPKYAEAETSLRVTRSEAIQLARQDNLDLQATRYAIRRAEAASVDAGALPNTEFSVSGGSDFAFNDEGEHTWSVGLSQQFPVTGRLRLMRSLSAQEIALAEAEVRVAELKLAAEVAGVFETLKANAAETFLLNQQLSLNAEFQQFLQTKVERAEASTLDMRQAQLVTASLQQSLGRLERQRARVLSEFQQLLALEHGKDLELASEGTEPPMELPVFMGDALANHPDFVLKQQLAEIVSTQSGLALAERWGDITVKIFFDEEYGIDEPVGFERERSLGIGVSIPLPLNNRNRGQIESSRQRERQIEAELRATKFRLLSQAESLRSAYLNVQHQIANYDSELLVPAEANLGELQDAYGAGLVSLTDVFRAQESLLELRLNKLSLESERAQLLTQWQFTTGRILP